MQDMQDKLHTDIDHISERQSATPGSIREVGIARGRWMHGGLRDPRVRTALIVISIVLVLLGIIVPPLRVLASLSQDYTQLKALGESGLHHLLAAKETLAPFSASTTALKGFQTEAAPVPQAPYSFFIQRQSGTGYTVEVSIHPSPSLASRGVGVAHVTPVVDANTILRLGAATLNAPKAPRTPLLLARLLRS